MRKHNPWVDWQGAETNGVPAADNMPLTSFPTNFDSLPTISNGEFTFSVMRGERPPLRTSR